MSDFEIRYTRQKPEEWDTLLAAIDPDETLERPVSVDQAQHAMRAAGALETDRLEVAGYYALGLGICGIARALHDDERRMTVATTIADNLTADGYRMRTFIREPGARAFNAMLGAVLEPLRELGVESYNALPTREHLAADALTTALRSRRGGFDMFTFKGRPNMMRTQAVQGGKAAAELIVSNATAGSIIVHAHQRAARAAATEPLVGQNPLRFAVQSASLHTEEFQGELYRQAVRYGANGSVLLDRSMIPPQPQLPERRITDIKHDERLVCPAVQVQYAIPGMLELMLDIERIQEQR